MKSLQNQWACRVWTSFVICAGLLCSSSAVDAKPKPSVTLDGETIQVYWNDGDSFRVSSRSHKGLKVRIGGYNTLENHGPVHQWGRWTKDQLLHLAYQAKDVANGHKWACFRVLKDGKVQKDHYGRTLIECPDLATELIEAGLAHVFAFTPEDVDPKQLEKQLTAQKEGVGMWALGVPDGIVTSAHSADEKPGEKEWRAYNRIANTRTGLMSKVEHDAVYPECTDVCFQGSCLLYVPFKRRYGNDRAACLFRKKKKDSK